MSKRSIAITIWAAPELHAQLEQQSAAVPMETFFTLSTKTNESVPSPTS